MTIDSERLDGLVVLGMHSSGTSALTGALYELGVSVGRNLIQPISSMNVAILKMFFWYISMMRCLSY